MLSMSTDVNDAQQSTRVANWSFKRERRRLSKEQRWRRRDLLSLGLSSHDTVFARRWVDNTGGSRDEEAALLADKHVVIATLRAVRVRLYRNTEAVLEGTMPSGTLHLSAPSPGFKASFRSHCDFIHSYFPNDHVTTCQEPLVASLSGVTRGIQHDTIIHDPLGEQLCHTPIAGDHVGNEACTEIVGRTVLMRVLGKQPGNSKVGALQRWRLKRVQDYVANHLDEHISLSNLASAAGLSRMHFAAQFKVATGYSPHDYLLRYRIEFAKAAMLVENMPLAEVALSAGFQAQSHFTTVFKRLTGDTPAHWRRTQLAESEARFANIQPAQIIGHANLMSHDRVCKAKRAWT
jgi:AraC family transcriptional regulator